MLRKFAAGSLVASCLIAAGGAAVFAIRVSPVQRFYPMTVLWCMLPFVWGVWMALAPESWLAARLPAWGAILGLILGVVGVYGLDMPQRVTGQVLPAGLRLLGVVLAAAIYFALWTIVAAVYRALGRGPAVAPTAA